MDPKRLEEFRKKLREGQPVRVVGGEVMLANAPPAAGKPAPGTAPAGGGAAPGTDAGAGVIVKQHEWGADEGWFYGRPDGEKRALQEQALLARDYPDFSMEVDDDGTPYVRGALGPSATLHNRYHSSSSCRPATAAE